MKLSSIGKIATLLIVLIWVVLYVTKPKELEFQVRGRVAGFGQKPEILIIEHEKIPGFMDAMTMPFTVKDTQMITNLSIGSPIQFNYYVKLEDQYSYIDEIIPIKEGILPALGKIATENHAFMEGLASNQSSFIQIGDTIPAITMIDQDGNSLQMNSFKGFDVVLTFIYTSCPVPDYCPLMSYNFKQLYEATSNKVMFISFSFDPERDRPQVLKAYGSNYVNSFERWKFVTAEKNTVKQMTNLFSVITQADSNSDQIIHNLRTVHINKDGIVEKIWPDNTWTVDEVLQHLNDTNK